MPMSKILNGKWMFDVEGAIFEQDKENIFVSVQRSVRCGESARTAWMSGQNWSDELEADQTGIKCLVTSGSWIASGPIHKICLNIM
jgi:hypothetical protein